MREGETMAKTDQPTGSSGVGAVSLKVTLRGTQPPIWRRLVMPRTMTLADLNQAIQVAMGWEESHLHAFDLGGRQYGDRSMIDDVADEGRVTLNGLVESGITHFRYTYDFGDDWEHMIVVEKRVALRHEATSVPICVAEKRACPPEDCGGVWGYERLLAIRSDPAHPDHAEQAEWFKDDVDPESFSVDIVNAGLSARFGR
jgi:hypothetical protein